MNRFLGRHGVIDADYERAAAEDPRFRALLPRDRTPAPLAGNTLIVVDPPSRRSAGQDLTGCPIARLKGNGARSASSFIRTLEENLLAARAL